MRKPAKYFFYTLFFLSPLLASDPMECMMQDLQTAEEVDCAENDKLPFFYDFSQIGGYFNMPSARMPPMGTFGFGAFRPPPYNIYGISFQPFDRIEASVNYRVYKGITEMNFGHEGFGDDADRIGNIKLGILTPFDGFPNAPWISIGADDFIGTSRFNSQYGVITKEWRPVNLETSIGWSRGRMKGWFGGAAWSPFRNSSLFFLKDLSLVAEYDNIDYKKHPHEHPAGRDVDCRINGGLIYVGCWDMLQVSLSTLRGRTIAGGASFRYPLGTTEGFLPKIKDPLPYTSPVDTEPLGVTRPEYEFVQELAYALLDQDLDLNTVYIEDCPEDGRHLWMMVINNHYREETVLRERLQDVLAALVPSNIDSITVVMEADAVPTQSYTFRTQDLRRYRVGLICPHELSVLAPMTDPVKPPCNGTLIFRRNKPVWLFTFRPRFLTFFGSASGKFKYSVGLIAVPEGYVKQCYYKIQFGYTIYSTMWDIKDVDRLNPSQLPNVRTDIIKYYQNNSISLEKAFIQRSFSLGKGCFYRLAAGYFEIAYGGVATEFLYYPVQGNWAVGVEAATVLKRRYEGVALTTKIRKFTGTHAHQIGFVGLQYFLSIYYNFKPLDLDLKVMAGQFLAKDKGARFEVMRQFPSGLRFGLWYTITNGHDKVNGRTYHDKGFIFSIPLDFFLMKSSPTYINYAMSAWVRDVGAIAETGKPLFYTLWEERN